MIRIAITDDHTMFRKGLVSLIGGWNDIELSFEASSGFELLQEISQKPVDVVLLDLEMPGMSGLQTCEILRNDYPDLKILILTFLVSPSEILRAIKIGANGYFTKDSHPHELRRAIKSINYDGFYYNHSLSKYVQNIVMNKHLYLSVNEKTEVTPRELEVIKLYAKGYNGKQIADLLNISLRTIESHKKNLMVKTNSKNFISVIVYAFLHNLISLSELK